MTTVLEERRAHKVIEIEKEKELNLANREQKMLFA
jgi:hypothetical protein